MLIDNTLLLSDKQEVKASCASENIIDQLAAGDAHTHAVFVMHADEDFAGVTELKISLQTADEENFAAPAELFAAAFAGNELKAGKTLLKAVLPLGARRYLRGYYTVSGAGTAGKVSLFVGEAADM